MPIPIALQVDDGIEDAVAQVVYYICAEAVTNAVRHAACGSISVSVTLEDGLVAVIVEDNGRGGATVRPDRASQGWPHGWPSAAERSNSPRHPGWHQCPRDAAGGARRSVVEVSR